MAKMNAWKVIDSTGKWIDTVYYLTDCDAEYVEKCESVYENVTVELIVN